MNAFALIAVSSISFLLNSVIIELGLNLGILGEDLFKITDYALGATIFRIRNARNVKIFFSSPLPNK